jgi:glucan biosynthesis protein
MDMARLRSEAFTRCQTPFSRPVVEAVPILDPPHGGADAEGMVYQEELAVRTTNLLDREGFYFSPRPRAAVNTLPMEIFVDGDNTGTYERKTWEDANPDYSSNQIQPPILQSNIPSAGRVLTELIIGHRSPRGDYPQLFDLRSSAYFRFAGYPPQVTGASLRLAAHKIFGLGGKGETATKEDFPIVRAIYTGIKDSKTANALVLVESELFCGALNMDMLEGDNPEVVIDSYWYTRSDFNWKRDPHTGLVAYSSMLWKTEKQTPERVSDEAHDSDILTVKTENGVVKKYPLDPPKTGLRVRHLTPTQQPVEWTLANEDRDPSHFADFQPALGNTNYNFRASYRVSLLETNVRTGVSLYEQAADGEYGDNIVAVSTLRQNIKKATKVDQFIRFKYKTTAFFVCDRF